MAGIKEVYWTNTALRQRNLIFEYWNLRNKNNEYSLKLNQKVKETIGLILQFPELGRKTDFKETRSIIIENYSLFYQLKNQAIIITAFWDNRQNPERLLELLK